MRMTFLFLLLAGFSFPVLSQNLSGVWSGKRTQNPGGCYPEYSLEIHITYATDTYVMGNAYNYFDKDHYTKINFTGHYNPGNRRLMITENLVLQYQVPDNCVPCIKTYDLRWSKDSGQDVLDGEWQGHEMGSVYACPPGKIHLAREMHPVFPVEVYQNDSLSRIQRALKLADREKELVKTLVFDTSAIKIELYDNAEIDGDTVTVFLNNTLLLYKKGLTDKALTLTLNAFPNTDYELMMYADNLGSIPPNTSLMVITAGNSRYELRLSSSEQKSAVVHFRYIPKSP